MRLFAASTINTSDTDASCSKARAPSAPVYSPSVSLMRVVVARCRFARVCASKQRPPPVLQQKQCVHSQNGLQMAVEPTVQTSTCAHLRSENCTARRRGLTGDPERAGTPFSGARHWPDHARVEMVNGLPEWQCCQTSVFRAAASSQTYPCSARS